MNSFALAAGACVSASGKKSPGEPRIRRPDFPGNPCVLEKHRISKGVFLSPEHVECVQDEQSVTSQTAAAVPCEALQAAHRGRSLGVGRWGGHPKVEHRVLP